MPVTHELKCNANYWDAVARGEKTFEVRRDDRGFQKGDIVVLQRWEDRSLPMRYSTRGLNNRVKELSREITFILTGGQFGIEPGYVVLGLSRKGSTNADTKEKER